MDLLDGGDAFYEAAQEEARVIVNVGYIVYLFFTNIIILHSIVFFNKQFASDPVDIIHIQYKGMGTLIT